MNEQELLAIYLKAKSIEFYVEGMKAMNVVRERRNESFAYSEESFFAAADDLMELYSKVTKE